MARYRYTATVNGQVRSAEFDYDPTWGEPDEIEAELHIEDDETAYATFYAGALEDEETLYAPHDNQRVDRVY